MNNYTGTRARVFHSSPSYSMEYNLLWAKQMITLYVLIFSLCYHFIFCWFVSCLVYDENVLKKMYMSNV